VSRGGRGFTLIELLAVCALMGSVLLLAGALVPQVSREAEGFAAAQERLEERWLAARLLRADVHRASSATVINGSLILQTRGGRVAWAPAEGGVARRAAGARRFRLEGGARFRTEDLPGGRLVLYELGVGADGLRGEALAGRDLRGAP